jgi:type IV pilus assembly protein PilN|tara:strand:- start:1812 stop:2399 length:588 start_codon:yes stop_codon:yes gene_type:complete
MAKINLLPWREERRKDLLNEFLVMLGLVALFAALTVGAVHFYHSQLIERQNTRIGYIDKRIKEVDKKITEIKELEKKKEALLSRMMAIESLQRDRPLIVHLFDELVRSLPEGLSIVDLKQQGPKITITGEAQSNARVSSFMRKIEQSEWIKGAKLKVIKESNKGQGSTTKTVNEFMLTFEQVMPSTDKEEGDEES